MLNTEIVEILESSRFSVKVSSVWNWNNKYETYDFSD